MPPSSTDDDFEVLDEMPFTASRPRAQGRPNSLEIERIDAEIAAVDAQIASLRTLRSALQADRQKCLKADVSSSSGVRNISLNQRRAANSKVTDYTGKTEQFEWSSQLKTTMRTVWGIQEFRLCQEGVCNANMDGRDILCLMPTGGGKSITYQLPALLSPGVTIVISPLLSLISDQVMHLREAGVECVMLTGNTSKKDQNDAFDRMTKQTKHGSRAGSVKSVLDQTIIVEIDLSSESYQPEKVAKSKRLIGVLEQLASSNRLARFVIDEAHCCSALGHDFRPDYKKLSVLKSLFPKVPILAVTATLSQKVLPDVLKILRLAPLTSGADLYRKNLHYSVIPKASNAKSAIEQMAEYILDKHPKQSGIVYCLSKKDAESVAQGLDEASNGLIKTGVYHADVIDSYKEAIHRDWKVGRIHCVCATIAFGLGIDKAETRYVLHATMSKSMDGYYQETGRAGRDGMDADCVLYFRHQDASRVLSLTLGEIDGSDKVHDMLRYAQDLVTCRKLAFNSYFATSASQILGNGNDHGVMAQQNCGHCDNCLRVADELETLDVTLDVWRSLKVMMEVSRNGGRLTLSGLSDLVRGLGGGVFSVVGKSHSVRERDRLDLEVLCNGKVTLSKERTETLLIDLTLEGYLQEDYHATAYSVNVYIQPGPKAMRYARLTEDAVHDGQHCPRYEYTFLAGNKGRRRSKAQGDTALVRGGQAKVRGRTSTKVSASDEPTRKRARRSDTAHGEMAVDSDIERMAMMEYDDLGLSD